MPDSTGRIDRALAARLRDALPGARVARAALLGEGWNAFAYRVPAADGAYVVRVPKLAWAAGEIERQACLMPRLRARGLPVVEGATVVREDDGRVLAGVHRYAEGEAGRAPGRVARAALARQVGEFLTRLHALPVADYRACGAEEHDLWPGFFGALVARTRDRLPARSRAWVDARVGELRRALRTAPAPVPLHDDLQPGHLVLDDAGTLVAVLDWSGPRTGDPALDFRRLVQFWGEPFAEATLARYDGAVDRHFRERMRLYAALGPLYTLDVSIERALPRWEAYARRQVAALAAAETRRIA